MINGMINVYKEQGYTSHDVVAKLRGILHQKKIGHTGTLDPNAVGVLPVCLGRGTKLCDMLTATKKQYRTTFQFGKETDTEDIWGEEIESFPIPNSEEDVRGAILSFAGDYDQIPPMYSAKKTQGKKLYELAREGKVVERKPQKVKIYEISNIEIRLPEVSMTVTCSKGTYIRSLCRDIGRKLQSGAYMTELIRTKSSGFRIENSHTLAQIEEAAKEGRLEEYIIPIEKVFSSLPQGTVQKHYNKLLYNGNPLKQSCFFETNLDIEKKLRVYDEDGHFIGIYQWRKQMFFPDKIFYDQND
ncbi:MAG TPA: tRNA pseudouridine(55) synthase TruB [Candidatus Anaerostipes excrementavium]|uniref:tRNA pseudouridine synthase B n=1 Tax=Candidatus Anaerostipes excrementavium TaxID=2838463 RepID=A0A9D1WTT1_9FIRM|nr:tRNA pseudouridine(55) synthase TruB [uncultured Anaerostipes sp.]HIX66706.1 tRNA pseudouridine(55) synthase TruB [Candidatus Anaerostipes excrementavium]